MFYRLCNQIQGRTPVIVIDFGFDPSDVCFWGGPIFTISFGLDVFWIHQVLVSDADPVYSHSLINLFLDDFWSSSEPLVDQISTWGQLWSMNSLVMASLMNYLTKNISELFIVLYNHIAIYSKSARPTFSKAEIFICSSMSFFSHQCQKDDLALEENALALHFRVQCPMLILRLIL